MKTIKDLEIGDSEYIGYDDAFMLVDEKYGKVTKNDIIIF